MDCELNMRLLSRTARAACVLRGKKRTICDGGRRYTFYDVYRKGMRIGRVVQVDAGGLKL